jgi:hypothetical protein
MESQRFDQLAKHLSRRGVTKGLLAGGVAGLVALLSRQTGQAQGCEATCAQEGCAGVRGEERGECQRNCVAQCGCPEGTTFCPDDGLCYNLQTNNCHCADVRVSGGSPCGGVCPGSGLGRCCENGLCTTGTPTECPEQC